MTLAARKDLRLSSQIIDPAILYFGTPVVLIGSCNDDDSFNLAPMSSAWWVGQRCMLGLASNSKTTGNILRSGECVLNLPSSDLVGAVDRLARTTGSDPVPQGKLHRGYRFEADKFGVSRLTSQKGDAVAAPRALECPVQIEARLMQAHPMAEEDVVWRGHLVALELSVVRIHVHPSIMMDGQDDRIDPDKWRPLIMSFQQYYGLALGRLQHSVLGEIPEAYYRPPSRPSQPAG
ncbi:conserved hypothetical protein [Rhodopseudomonas palustris BisB5]|uniref:Flavin reductase like domain-containing protein n=1 Tax=Rhodopseudomonas palustris (strain BisB5) TaxID=316057 RepID=Q13F08_RHOPS|nr:conserved hypothetical protein [Rhodopseudomonas palustris BisB5]